MGSKSENLKDFEPWGKQHLEVFTKDGSPSLRMVTEYNEYHGELVVAFQIGEELSNTGVKCRYTDQLLPLQEEDSLCGERAFEDGSITYEFLLKPLGISFKPGNGNLRTSFYWIMDALIEKGYTRKINH